MTLPPSASSALGLGLGFAADRLLGDPRRGHPVAGFGRLAMALERRIYRDRRAAGVTHEAVLVGGAVALGVAAERLARPGWPRLVVTTTATWAVLGGRSLAGEATTIAGQLAAADLPAARRQVRNLVGRDPSVLDADGVARAVVESVAENTSDAVVAPLVWGALAGAPGLLGYRAVNTLDAMVGHRSARYTRFGWAAARVDDVANWVPARVVAGIAALASPLVGGTATATWRTVRRDAPRHPSPNAGPVEAAFAGALGVRLGGVNVYQGTAEDRGVLGDGRPVGVPDLARATRLAAAVGTASAALSVVLRLILTRRPALPRRRDLENRPASGSRRGRSR